MGAAPASQSERFCRTNRRLSDKNTARYPLARVKVRRSKFLPMVSEVLRYGSCGRVGSRCNITTSGDEKSPLNGLERTRADIGSEAFRQVVYCHRNKYSDKETDSWTNIYRNNHPDMRMIRCRNGEIYNSRNKYLNKSAFIRQFIEAGRERNLCCNYLVSDMRVL